MKELVALAFSASAEGRLQSIPLYCVLLVSPPNQVPSEKAREILNGSVSLWYSRKAVRPRRIAGKMHVALLYRDQRWYSTVREYERPQDGE